MLRWGVKQHLLGRTAKQLVLRLPVKGQDKDRFGGPDSGSR